jgi:hypothetical protein
MNRTKLGLLGLCAVVLGIMAMSASSAQAFSWLLLNTKMEAVPYLNALLAYRSDTKDLTLFTKEVGIKFAITCSGEETVGISLAAEGKLNTGGKIKYTGCEAYGKGSLEEALGCKVHSAGQAAGTVETGKLKGELVLHELAGGTKELLTKVEPEAGSTGTLATILTEGCVIPESNPVHGVLYARDCEGKATEHKAEHLIVSGPLTSLWVGSDTAEHLETSVSGSVWVLLAGPHLGYLFGWMEP